MDGDKTHGDTIVRAKLEKWIRQIRPSLEGKDEVRQTIRTIGFTIRSSGNL